MPATHAPEPVDDRARSETARRRRPVAQWLVAALLVATGILLVVVALNVLDTPRQTASPPPGPVTTAPARDSAPPPRAKPERPREPPPVRPDPAVGVPTRLLVPGLAINAPVVRIGVTDGVLIPPADPQVLGWWGDGARPGALRGSTLVTGHTVHDGGGALDNLEELEAGDPVRVRTANGSVAYDVRKVTVYRKASLAEHASVVFNQERLGRLVLITCEDWDGEKYLSNVVVIARPA